METYWEQRRKEREEELRKCEETAKELEIEEEKNGHNIG